MFQRFPGTDQVVENNGGLPRYVANQEGARQRRVSTVLFHQRTAHRTSQLSFEGLTKLFGTLGAAGVRGHRHHVGVTDVPGEMLGRIILCTARSASECERHCRTLLGYALPGQPDDQRGRLQTGSPGSG